MGVLATARPESERDRRGSHLEMRAPKSTEGGASPISRVLNGGAIRSVASDQSSNRRPRSPDAACAERGQGFVGGDEREIFAHRLGGEHPIEGIAVCPRQGTSQNGVLG